MTKWVENKDVVFTCQRDIFEYLLMENHAVINVYGKEILSFIEGYCGAWCFDEPTSWKPMKRAEWYEDIPEKGVLGKAYPGRSEEHIILLCTGHDDKYAFPFKCQNGMEYSRFIPFTKEEAIQYILPD